MSEGERILVVVDSLGPGGAEHALLTLVPGLSARGHTCLVAALGPPYDLAPAFRERGVELRLLGYTGRSSLPASVIALARLIREFRPTVVHAHLFLAGLCAAVTRPVNRDAARIATFHNLGYDSYPVSSLWRRARRQLDRVTMRRGMDAWLAVSEAVREHYSANLGLRGIEVVPNGVDVSDILARREEDVAAGIARLGVEPCRPLLLCAGRFRHEKGHRYLVAALDLLRARGLHPVLVLAGSGPLKDAVAADVAARDLQAHVRFLGHLSHRELMDLMAGVDIVVLSSTHEGLPVTAVEAMILGKPVVATRVGGLPELIEHERTGLLVPAASPAATARAIERLLGDQGLRERVGAQGRLAAERMCGLDRVLDAHERLFAALRAR